MLLGMSVEEWGVDFIFGGDMLSEAIFSFFFNFSLNLQVDGSTSGDARFLMNM